MKCLEKLVLLKIANRLASDATPITHLRTSIGRLEDPRESVRFVFALIKQLVAGAIIRGSVPSLLHTRLWIGLVLVLSHLGSKVGGGDDGTSSQMSREASSSSKLPTG